MIPVLSLGRRILERLFGHKWDPIPYGRPGLHSCRRCGVLEIRGGSPLD